MKTKKDFIIEQFELVELSKQEYSNTNGGDPFMKDLGKFLGDLFGGITSRHKYTDSLTFGKI
ncbi:MAG: hypothetical protein RBR30_02775 [Tenuifilaceae bacterium]|nr:hypothetical protein [Tenuifilaceae bacterium]